MGIWDSLGLFARPGKRERRRGANKQLGRRKARKPRDLRVEQFEERILLSISPTAPNDETEPVISVGPVPVAPVAGDIVYIGPGPAPGDLDLNVPHNVNAADTTNADDVKLGGTLGLGLEGAGYTIGVWDGGAVRDTHQEFAPGRVTVVDPGTPDYHATHVAGTIAASGVDPAAEGMGTQLNIRSYDWTNDLTEMDTDAALIAASNHSYGAVTGWHV